MLLYSNNYIKKAIHLNIAWCISKVGDRMNQKRIGKRTYGGAITVVVPEGVVEVASDNLKESERIANSMLEKIKSPKTKPSYIQ